MYKCYFCIVWTVTTKYCHTNKKVGNFSQCRNKQKYKIPSTLYTHHFVYYKLIAGIEWEENPNVYVMFPYYYFFINKLNLALVFIRQE